MSQNIEDNRKKFPGEYSNFTVADNTVNSKKIWEPPSDYNKGGQYGKVRAYTWRAGQSVEIDETKGGERIRVIHPNGSYVDMQHDGQTIYRSNNHSYEVILGDQNVRVKGNCNIHIGGNAFVKVDGNMTTEVGGDKIEKIGGKWTVKAGSDITFETGGNINLNK